MLINDPPPQSYSIHRRVNIQQDVLGIGLTADSVNRVSSFSLELISHGAFVGESVRNSLTYQFYGYSGWQPEPSRFTHWLPLMLSETHTKRAMPHLIKFFQNIGGKDVISSEFAHEMGLSLMNCAATFMNESIRQTFEAGTNAETFAKWLEEQRKFYPAEKQFGAFCWFYHIWLELSEEYTGMNGIGKHLSQIDLFVLIHIHNHV
jgi:hypothetical protein